MTDNILCPQEVPNSHPKILATADVCVSCKIQWLCLTFAVSNPASDRAQAVCSTFAQQFGPASVYMTVSCFCVYNKTTESGYFIK
jgi:hypothetical protein